MDQSSDPFDKGPPGNCLRHSILRNFFEIINYLSNHSWQYGKPQSCTEPAWIGHPDYQHGHMPCCAWHNCIVLVFAKPYFYFRCGISSNSSNAAGQHWRIQIASHAAPCLTCRAENRYDCSAGHTRPSQGLPRFPLQRYRPLGWFRLAHNAS